MRLPVALLLTFGWQSAAQAFFCFNFGGHARHDGRLHGWAWQPPPPPQLLAPRVPVPGSLQTVDSGAGLPPIREPKKSPDVIQGYRFRPLDGTASPPPVTPADWRD